MSEALYGSPGSPGFFLLLETKDKTNITALTLSRAKGAIMDNNQSNNPIGGLVDKAKDAVEQGKEGFGDKVDDLKDGAEDMKDKLTGSNDDNVDHEDDEQ